MLCIHSTSPCLHIFASIAVPLYIRIFVQDSNYLQRNHIFKSILAILVWRSPKTDEVCPYVDLIKISLWPTCKSLTLANNNPDSSLEIYEIMLPKESLRNLWTSSVTGSANPERRCDDGWMDAMAAKLLSGCKLDFMMMHERWTIKIEWIEFMSGARINILGFYCPMLSSRRVSHPILSLLLISQFNPLPVCSWPLIAYLCCSCATKFIHKSVISGITRRGGHRWWVVEVAPKSRSHRTPPDWAIKSKY